MNTPDPMCNERGIPESDCPDYCRHGAAESDVPDGEAGLALAVEADPDYFAETRPIGPDGFTPLWSDLFGIAPDFALGDDGGTLADLREQVEMLTAQRDNAERKHERLESAVEALANEWERTHRDQLPHLGCLDMYRHCAELLRALLPGGVAGVTLPAHHLLDANLSMTCTNCGGHTELTPPCIPARTLAGEVG